RVLVRTRAHVNKESRQEDRDEAGSEEGRSEEGVGPEAGGQGRRQEGRGVHAQARRGHGLGALPLSSPADLGDGRLLAPLTQRANGRTMKRLARLGVVISLVAANAGCSVLERARGNWWELSREPSGQSPDPAATPEAVVQVYAARAVGWRGLLALHPWIALKPSGAAGATRYAAR